MIRLFSFNQQEIHLVQRLAASFIINSYAQLNRFSFEHLTQPHTIHDLQLHYLRTQANAPQWCCLDYPLQPSQLDPKNMLSIRLLRFTFNFILAIDKFLIAFTGFYSSTLAALLSLLKSMAVSLTSFIPSTPSTMMTSNTTAMSTFQHASIYLCMDSSASTHHQLIQPIPHLSSHIPAISDTQLRATFADQIYLPTTYRHYNLNNILLQYTTTTSTSAHQQQNYPIDPIQ